MMGKMTQEEAQAALGKLIEGLHRPVLALLEKQLETLGGTYIAGNKLTIADCAMVSNLANIWENPKGPWTEAFKPVLADYPKVQAYHIRLREAFKDRFNDPNRVQQAI